MALVRNTGKVKLSLCAFGELTDRDRERLKAHPSAKVFPRIDRISIMPGAQVEVEERFVLSKGAASQIGDGSLQVVTQELIDAEVKAAEAQAKAKKAAEDASSVASGAGKDAAESKGKADKGGK